MLLKHTVGSEDLINFKDSLPIVLVKIELKKIKKPNQEKLEMVFLLLYESK